MYAMRVTWGAAIAVSLLISGSVAGPAGGLAEARSSAIVSSEPGSSGSSAPPCESVCREHAERYGIAPDLAAIIVRQSVRAGVEPGLVFGLIAVESGFDARAVGRSGERGLMQIKVSTARAYEPGLAAERLFEPEVNLRIGIAHLRREAAHFGDWALGLMAYNMGRTRLGEILETGRRPSRAYVARVVAGCAFDCI